MTLEFVLYNRMTLRKASAAVRATLPSRFEIAIAIFLLGTVLVAGCGTPLNSTASFTATPAASQPALTLTAASPVDPPTITPSSTATATAAAVQVPLTHYHLSVQFDYTSHHVAVAETIMITNRWEDPLLSLVLDVEPDEYSDVFVLNSIALNGTSLLDTGAYTLKANKLEIPLSEPLMPGIALTLSLDYELFLPPIMSEASSSFRPDPFGFSDHQTNLVNWYPYLAAYDPGQGWIIHDRYAFGEHEVYDAADYSIDLELVNPPADLVIAASAPNDAPQDQNGVIHYSLPRARTFAISASTGYVISTRQVGSTTVTSYYFPWDGSAGEAALDATANALALYSELFGPYERPSLNVIEADFLDGMEFDGLYFLSNGFYNLYDGTPSGYLTAIAVHETAHQWWYGKVGSDQAMEPWLDEAMSTYTEKLYYENVSPGSLSWWQSARIDYFAPQGYINLPVRDYRYYEPYRNSVYLNGSHFLQDLRDLIGDDAFFAFLKDYATKFAYQRTTTKDFFTLLSEHTSVDLAPLISQYFDPSLFP